ncbi:hypothetical protein [Lysinibacillus sphaericus]|uniref:Uncharacterized protein n=1 Tax=Lysinibacillus sphaericus OT4b.31 TaxID=1285586 RepID=R7ZFQ9_LYSSH|nr:hypothetical protein [Lysinibacillus sphaericus]EON72876.1 hypothetical protein H131_09213 [Lysinibacillus sphaericus OT4b.31]
MYPRFFYRKVGMTDKIEEVTDTYAEVTDRTAELTDKTAKLTDRADTTQIRIKNQKYCSKKCLTNR